MKKLMFAFLALFVSVVAVNAQETPSPSNEAVSVQQDEKVKIKSEELPEAVKKSLEAQEYKGWLINAAYQDKKAETYEVELKNGAETKIVKFDKEGKKVE
jgi:hypothetical protein